jgi:glycerol-3-phosphate cytidylyltransferase-like family protein
VTVDDLVPYKNKRAVIPFEERIEIVRACRYVDLAVAQESMDKIDAWQRYKFGMIFVGDDWYRHERWKLLDTQMRGVGVRVVYFPYTKTTSSTLVNETLERLRATDDTDPGAHSGESPALELPARMAIC